MEREKASIDLVGSSSRLEQSDAAIRFIEADESWIAHIAEFSQWGQNAARHVHLVDGFAIVALELDRLAGFISVYWKALPAPLAKTCEAYIDILEVREDLRRRGVAARLIGLSAQRAREKGAYQLRSWSSLDKQEAIAMWKALGFGLCPAITFPQGQEVRGYFVAMPLGEEN